MAVGELKDNQRGKPKAEKNEINSASNFKSIGSGSIDKNLHKIACDFDYIL